MYQVQQCVKHWEEDSFEKGCLPETSRMADIAANWLRAETVAELVAKLHEFLDSRPGAETLDACDEPGRIDVEVMETDEGRAATDADLDAWERGELRLWLACYSFYVVQTQPVSLANAA